MLFKVDALELVSKFTGKHLCWSLFLNKFRSSLSQMLFKLVVLKNIANFTGKHLCQSLFLMKFQAFRTATLLKKDSCEICKIFKNILFSWASPVVAPDSFRFPAWNFVEKEIPAKMFFYEFCKIFKNAFWQNTSRWLLLNFICEFWEVFQSTSFIEHLWEAAYFI